MASYILHITYTVEEGKRSAFLALAKELKQHFAGDMGKQYSIYEVKGRANMFVEQFSCATREEFDALEDDLSEKGEALINRLTDLIEEGAAKYSTLVEI
jgi:hypothetical protein